MPVGNESNHLLNGLTIKGGLKFEDLDNQTVGYLSANNLGANVVVQATNGASFDRAAIQAAIDGLGAQGGTVVLGPGTFWLDGSIVMKDATSLVGQGWGATILKLGAAQNVPVITNYQSPDNTIANAERVGVYRLMIDGNKSNQTVSGNCHGIFFTSTPSATQATNDWDFDTLQVVRDVMIYRCKDNGYYALSRQSSEVSRVWAYRNDGIGFRPSYDTVLANCVAGRSGLQGFYLGQSSQQLVGCKSYYSGQVTGTSGDGFFILSNSSGSSLVDCVAQDNLNPGFTFNNTQRGVTLMGCVADSNGTRSAGNLPAYDFFTAQDNRLIGCIACERKADGSTSYQQNALRIRSSSTNNKIDILFRTNNAATLGAAIMASSDSVAGNDININNLSGNQTVAYAATITPDVYAGGRITVALTGNMTINAPSTGHAGAQVTFIFSQDATAGRTLTWNAAYKTTTSILASGSAATNGQTASITFQSDGTNWIPVSVVAWH